MIQTFNGVLYKTTGKSWQWIVDIPVGSLFVPDFDDLIHPMRKTAYLVSDHSELIDQEDGECLSPLLVHNWWSWVPRFLEVRNWYPETQV